MFRVLRLDVLNVVVWLPVETSFPALGPMQPGYHARSVPQHAAAYPARIAHWTAKEILWYKKSMG